VHRLRHNNINPGPFSGLSMHPFEHLFHFSAVVLYWIVPSHPVHAIYNLVHHGLALAGGYTGDGGSSSARTPPMTATAMRTICTTNISSVITPIVHCRSAGGSTASTVAPMKLRLR
jgi:hypothetical protein